MAASPSIHEAIFIVAFIGTGTFFLNTIVNQLTRNHILSNVAAWLLKSSALYRYAALGDLHQPPSASLSPSVGRGYLETLPKREKIQETPQSVTKREEVRESEVCDHLLDLAERQSEHVYLGHETFDGGHTSLYARQRHSVKTEYLGEIAQLEADTSDLRLTLHPSDVKLVIEQGWGQRHRLSRESTGLFCWWYLVSPVKSGCVNVYIPQSRQELVIVRQLVHAAGWWVAGLASKE